MRRRDPKYLFLVISLLGSTVLITSSAPLSLLGNMGIVGSALSLLVTAYLVAERRRHLLLVVVLGASALLPFAWFSVFRGALAPRLVNGIYVLNLVVWLLFTVCTALIVFRDIMTARRVRGNEIYGAIYVYLLIGVMFAQAYQLLLVWQPDALRFDPGLFPGPEAIGSSLHVRGPGDMLYYSFVTLGTFGYGDVTPSSPLARSVSLIEAMVGIMYVATMIARFVSIQINSREQGRESP